MDTQSFQRSQRTPVFRLLLLAVLAAWAAQSWAAGQSSRTAPPRATSVRAPAVSSPQPTVNRLPRPAEAQPMRTEPAGPHPTGTRTVQPYDARFPQHRPVRGAGARIVRPVAPSSVQPHGAKPELSTRREPERTRILSSGEILQPRRSVASSRVSSSEGERRDPFRLPEVPDEKVGARHLTEQGTGAALPPGARGLLVSQLKLQGVVREQDGNKMIAVVTNETNRAYFLTENESLYNGVVSKITPDAVYFKENVLGTAGRVKTREVVKRLGSAPGEGR